MLNRQARFAPRNGHCSDWQLCCQKRSFEERQVENLCLRNSVKCTHFAIPQIWSQACQEMVIDLIEFFRIVVDRPAIQLPYREPVLSCGHGGTNCDARGTPKAPRRLYHGRH